MKKCPQCGISLITVELTRKVGCPNCYSYYQQEIVAMLEGADLSEALMVSPLEQQEHLIRSLEDAVAREEYEEAARLRDKINAAELDVDSYPNK